MVGSCPAPIIGLGLLVILMRAAGRFRGLNDTLIQDLGLIHTLNVKVGQDEIKKIKVFHAPSKILE